MWEILYLLGRGGGCWEAGGGLGGRGFRAGTEEVREALGQIGGAD